MIISLVTVSYNSEKTIERTIRSVLNQTYTDYEYIIIDGKSTDSTIEIIKYYEPFFEGRLKWISEPDKGIYNAMNKGIKKSIGNIIGIVNSDDWLETDAVEQVIKLASQIKTPCDAIYCGSLKFHYQDKTVQLLEADETRFNVGMKYGSMNHGAYHPSMFVGRNVYRTVGVFDEKFRVIADADFINRCYKANIKFYFTQAVLNNMSDGGASNMMNLKIRIPDKLYECRKNGYSKLLSLWIVLKYVTILLLKAIVPSQWIKAYRKKHN